MVFYKPMPGSPGYRRPAGAAKPGEECKPAPELDQRLDQMIKDQRRANRIAKREIKRFLDDEFDEYK